MVRWPAIQLSQFIIPCVYLEVPLLNEPLPLLPVVLPKPVEDGLTISTSGSS